MSLYKLYEWNVISSVHADHCHHIDHIISIRSDHIDHIDTGTSFENVNYTAWWLNVIIYCLETEVDNSLQTYNWNRRVQARCSCLDRGRRQLDLGRSPSPIRLRGTVSRLIFVIPGLVCWLSDVDSRLICLIPLVIYLRSCPLDSYFCIVLVCERLAAFVTIFKKSYFFDNNNNNEKHQLNLFYNQASLEDH